MQLVTVPNQILNQKTKPIEKVTPELVKTAREMIKFAKTFQDPEGVGLASAQVGRNEAFFVAKIGKKFEIIFNPQILKFSNKKRTFFEGCLSVPDYYAEIVRPVGITAIYQDKSGQSIKKKYAGIAAWIFQHEYDHLQGKLFTDYIKEQKAPVFKYVGKDSNGADLFERLDTSNVK